MVFAALLDLILPDSCAGCDAPASRSLCDPCARLLHEPPFPTRPTPAPAGLPPCVSGGVYEGPVRRLLLAYKEQGRRGLAIPLGDRLAEVVRAGWPAPGPLAPGPLALVPVPGTAAANRRRHGDHMLRLARRAAATLVGGGVAALVVQPLRARPKADSTHLDRDARARAARQAFALRGPPAPPLTAAADLGAVVLLDDVLTTGATRAAAAGHLARAGLPVAFAATLASTRLRAGSGLEPDPGPTARAEGP